MLRAKGRLRFAKSAQSAQASQNGLHQRMGILVEFDLPVEGELRPERGDAIARLGLLALVDTSSSDFCRR